MRHRVTFKTDKPSCIKFNSSVCEKHDLKRSFLRDTI